MEHQQALMAYPQKLVKLLGPRAKKELRNFINSIFQGKEVPDAWKPSRMNLIYEGRGDKSAPFPPRASVLVGLDFNQRDYANDSPFFFLLSPPRRLSAKRERESHQMVSVPVAIVASILPTCLPFVCGFTPLFCTCFHLARTPDSWAPPSVSF